MKNKNFNFNFYSINNKIELIGELNKSTLVPLVNYIKKNKISTLELKNLTSIDSCSIIYLISLEKEGIKLNNIDKFKTLYEHYKKYYLDKIENNKQKDNSFIEVIGKNTFENYKEIKQFINFLGKLSYYFIFSLFNPKKIRFKEMLKYIDASAISALSIITLTSFLVGIVIAYQGAVQLEKFGANIFIVEMICITMFREIAPLLTAIVIAGRTASSYTAQIGAMKITEEIDAMKTMAFEPMIFLTLPRVFALFIALPLLVFFADIIAVGSGMIVAYIDLNITYTEFINRMYEEVEVRHLIIGIVKSIFFGVAIAVIGCYRGFQVKNNTTSIGKYTTISVVNAIFTVIALNAIFSVILTESGL